MIFTSQFVTRSIKKIDSHKKTQHDGGNTQLQVIGCEVTQVNWNLFWIGCEVTDRFRL